MLHYQELHPDCEPTTIIIHGLFGSGDNWKSLAKWLPEQRILLIDLPGHGQSELRGHWQHSKAAQQVLHLADRLQIGQFSLLGHSLGGKVAMSIANMAAERIEQLIIADIAPKDYSPHHSHIFKALQTIDCQALTNRRDAEQQLAQQGVKMKAVRQFLLKSLFHDGQHYQWRLAVEQLGASQPELSQAPELTQTFEGDCLFILGEHSDYVQLSDYQLIRQYYPQAQIERLPQAGHWLHVEQPDAFMSLVRRALQLP